MYSLPKSKVGLEVTVVLTYYCSLAFAVCSAWLITDIFRCDHNHTNVERTPLVTNSTAWKVQISRVCLQVYTTEV